MSWEDGEHVVGVDLSLRRAAACAVPVDWDKRGHRLDLVRTMTVGGELVRTLTADGEPDDADSERQRVVRLKTVAWEIVAFCELHRATHVAVEQYAMGTGKQSHKHSIGEVGGVFKVKLYETLGLVAEPIVASRARKVFAGKLPRSDVKGWIVEKVKSMGGPTTRWTPDEVDAFICTNYLYMMTGRVALTVTDGEKSTSGTEGIAIREVARRRLRRGGI